MTRRSFASDERLLAGWHVLRQVLKRFSLQLPVFLQQNFHLAFGVFQFLPAGRREIHAFFKKSQALFQRHISLFQLLNYFFQSLEALFKFSQRSFRSFSNCTDSSQQAFGPSCHARAVTPVPNASVKSTAS